MMEFQDFKKLQQQHVKKLFKDVDHLYVTDVDKDEMWNLYLESFPEGENEIFRERREFDCSCCRSFIKSFGNVVAIKNNKIITIWDFKATDSIYEPVCWALDNYVKSKPIIDEFVTTEAKFGTDINREMSDDGSVLTWHHFRIELDPKFIYKGSKTTGTIASYIRTSKEVFKRSLEEISMESIDIILELIAQKSLYKGDEWQDVLTLFKKLHKDYSKTKKAEKDNYCWVKSAEIGPSISKIRNHSIGVLLTDITEGMELDKAVKRYENIVAPSNYKRPKAIFTQKMVEQAKKTIEELGFLDSLNRRFATIDDITINNILFANKDTLRKLKTDVFDDLVKETSKVSAKSFNKIDEIGIDDFMSKVLPNISNIEILFENRHESNLVSLIAPSNKDSKSMFKWNNNFSWAYNGNITDSMKQHVKAAGGKVDGVLRFSIQWNDDDYNPNDFDAHCIEPDKNEICFRDKVNRYTTGNLDVDIIAPLKNKVAVENITWTDINKMQEGVYHFFVHNYSHRGGHQGFKAQIEYDGQIYDYSYDKELKPQEKITVAKIKFSKKNGIEFVESLDSTVSSRNIWKLNTNNFYPVSVAMFSPNYWDEQKGIGHKHYFFIIKDCINETEPNGFFNEFLNEELMEHRKVFEALGSKMKVSESDKQLSGLGFSSTKRNSIVCKVEGHIKRTLKLTF